MVKYLQPVTLDDLADNDRVEIPFIEYLDDLFFAALASDDQHSLLRFRQQHFVCGHPGLTLWDERQIKFEAGAGPRRHFDRR